MKAASRRQKRLLRIRGETLKLRAEQQVTVTWKGTPPPAICAMPPGSSITLATLQPGDRLVSVHIDFDSMTVHTNIARASETCTMSVGVCDG